MTMAQRYLTNFTQYRVWQSQTHAWHRLPHDGFDVQDRQWMAYALQLAEDAAAQQEVPVGAVLVCDGQLIGQGFNQPITTHDPTAHAEIVALRHACCTLQNYRLPANSTLYVTLEPCTLCVGALIHARVARVVFAATEPKAGSLMSARQLLVHSGYYNHVFRYAGGLMADDSRRVLQTFFKARRQKAD